MKNFIFLIGCVACNCVFAQVQPIQHGHAHNDYEHKRPLFEALENGFTSIEIDVYIHNDDLIVSHAAVGLDSKPDIENLYLKPIQKIIQQNGGWVYKGYKQPVIFMIDCKTGGKETYDKLKEVLGKYADILAVYHHDSIIKPGPIQILISGNKPFEFLAKEETSFMTMDADLNTIDKNQYNAITTRYSDPWGTYFTWAGNGEMPDDVKSKLNELVKKAHALKEQIRFYHIPDKPNAWKALLDAGVDWINTDKLKEYAEFWRKRALKP
jgi:hypothetical protein